MKNRCLKWISIGLVLSLGLVGCSSSGSDETSEEETTEESTENIVDENETEVLEDETDAAEEDAESSEEDSTNSSYGDAVEITFWYANSQDYVPDAAERFNESVGAEEGIVVTVENQGDYSDTHQKLQAAYIAGTAPEMCVVEISSIRRFAESGMIIDLEDYAEEFDVDLDDYYEGFMENCYVDGTLYAIPFLRSTSIMYMNNDLIEEAGYDPDAMDTWDDVIEAATAVYETTGSYGMTYWCGDAWIWEAFMLSYGEFTVNDDETECTVDGEATRTIINMFLDLEDLGVAHILQSADTDNFYSDIMTGNTAFFWTSTGGLTTMLDYAEAAGYELGTAFIPAGTQHGCTTGGCNIVISNGLSEEKEHAAKTFLNWLTSEEETVAANIWTGYLTTRKSAADDEEMVALYEESPQFKVALDQLEYAQGRPSNTGYAELETEINNALDLIWNGADIDSTLADLTVKGNELLNE